LILAITFLCSSPSIPRTVTVSGTGCACSRAGNRRKKGRSREAGKKGKDTLKSIGLMGGRYVEIYEILIDI
jgi:hypothetical protein